MLCWEFRCLHGGGMTDQEHAQGRVLVVDLQPPLPEKAGRYAQLCLGRVRGGLSDVLDADDLVTWDVLLDCDGPDGVLRRADLTVRTARRAWVVRRP